MQVLAHRIARITDLDFLNFTVGAKLRCEFGVDSCVVGR